MNHHYPSYQTAAPATRARRQYRVRPRSLAVVAVWAGRLAVLAAFEAVVGLTLLAWLVRP